jgi:hypothetical protein
LDGISGMAPVETERLKAKPLYGNPCLRSHPNPSPPLGTPAPPLITSTSPSTKELFAEDPVVGGDANHRVQAWTL